MLGRIKTYPEENLADGGKNHPTARAEKRLAISFYHFHLLFIFVASETAVSLVKLILFLIKN